MMEPPLTSLSQNYHTLVIMQAIETKITIGMVHLAATIFVP